MASDRTLEGVSRLVIKRAIRWWRGHRPLGWSERQHLDQYWVNCSSEWDKDLSRVVARYLRERARG